jgi:hypothetical protein
LVCYVRVSRYLHNFGAQNRSRQLVQLVHESISRRKILDNIKQVSCCTAKSSIKKNTHTLLVKKGATMFEKFARSWELVKASGDVLVTDKQLLVFPLVSSIAAGIVSLAFILPMLGLVGLDGLAGMVDGGRKISAGTYLMG